MSLPLLGATVGIAAFALLMASDVGMFTITLDEPTYAGGSVGLLAGFIALVCGPALIVYLAAACAVLAGSSRRWVWVSLLVASLLLGAAQLWGLPGALDAFDGAPWLVGFPVACAYLAVVSLYAVLHSRGAPVPSMEP